MIPNSPQHQTYILRVWYIQRQGQFTPVASLENCGDSETLLTEEGQPVKRLAFPSLEALHEFLKIAARDWADVPSSQKEE